MIVANIMTFGRTYDKPNLFIGGVSATINTAAILATRLGIVASRVKGFKVVGNNIECNILDSYTLPPPATSSFGNSGITYYRDFENAHKNFGFGGSDSAFNGNPTIVEVYLKNALQFNEGTFILCPELEILDFPNLTTVGNQPFQVNPKLVTFNALNLNNNSGAGNFLTKCILLEEANTPIINRLNFRHYEGCTNLKRAIHNLATFVNANAFKNCNSINEISLKKCTEILGNSSNNNLAFFNIKLNCLIKVNIFLLTSGVNGTPNENLTYAKNIRNATVEFYDDNGNYVSTL